MTKIEPLSLRRRLALEIWRKGYQHIVEEHPLRQLFWECTLRCNLHCRHCGSDCKVKAGVTDPWGMVTNALYLTPQKFNDLLNAGLHTMTISMDGLGDEHNWMRGNKHSFEMVSQAIDLLVSHPEIKFDILTCVNRRNYSHLDAIRQFLIDKGVKNWRVVAVFPVGRAASDPDMHLMPEEYKGILEFIKQTRKEGRIACSYGCEGFMGNFEGDIRNTFYGCHAGVTVGSVLVDGSISACASIRSNYHQGNIYQDDFMDIWQHRFLPYRNREWMRKGECAECRYFRYCQGSGMHLRDDEGNLIMCPLHRCKPSFI